MAPPETSADPVPAGNPPAPARRVIGVDVGGSGVKAALVNLELGDLASERLRVETPHPATPDAVADAVLGLVEELGGADQVGVTVPAVVRDGVVRTAANIDPGWIGTDARELFGGRLGVPVEVLNDADAAGIAEMRYGAGIGRTGVVVIVTLGTGIGSAVFSSGHLVPNTELGHLEFRGGDAEDYAAASVREREGLSWKKWGHRVGRYLRMLDRLFSPELFVIGGGVSKHLDLYEDHMRAKMGTSTEVVAAHLLNQAGIVGAALVASGNDTIAEGGRATRLPGSEEAPP